MEVYLPEGDWYDFWTGEKVAGGKMINVPLSIENIPVYVKAGAMITTSPLLQNTSEYTSEKLNISYYYDKAASSSEVYFDDGNTKGAYAAGAYQLMQLNTSPSAEGLEITCRISGNGYEGAPSSRSGNFTLYGLDKAPTSINEGDIAFEWDEEAKVLRFEAELVDGAKLVLH
jgi:oligosaccharide 4-alpha-D-glucosyltransferase